jgi:hypothetical protein
LVVTLVVTVVTGSSTKNKHKRFSQIFDYFFNNHLHHGAQLFVGGFELKRTNTPSSPSTPSSYRATAAQTGSQPD